MDHAEIDAAASRATDPTLIPGIYNYCDRRCDRCPFTARCLTFRETQAALDAEPDHSPESVLAMTRRSIGRAADMLRDLASRFGIDLDLDSQDAAADIREHEAIEARALADPLVTLGQEYARLAWPIVRALGPVVAVRRDEVLADAVAVIGETCTSVASKVYRAIVGSLEADYDADEQQSDVNGSAKVARLLVQESRSAWRVLMEVGRATADGVPAQLVRRLDDLDARLAGRFPNAMRFVRPGFDTEGAAPPDPPGPAAWGP